MDIKLTGRKPQGEGKYLFVVVKKDTDNYKGLWLANSKEELRENLILENMDSDDPNDPVYDENFTYMKKIVNEQRNILITIFILKK